MVSLLVATALLLSVQSPAKRENPHPAIKEFMDRVQGYVDLRKKVEGTLPPPSKKEEDPAEIVKYEQRIAAGIRAARSKAVRGEIFIPGIQPILINSIKQELASANGATTRKMILGEGNPTSGDVKVDLSVNATYPPAASLSTVPPSILQKLPTLPNGMEYRFVGRNLILYDARANLIIDIVADAVR